MAKLVLGSRNKIIRFIVNALNKRQCSFSGSWHGGKISNLDLNIRMKHTQMKTGDMNLPIVLQSNYRNSIERISKDKFPGTLKIEKRLESFTKWNAFAMVSRANQEHTGLGGHLSSYASWSTILNIAYNHFLQGGKGKSQKADQVYFQGHSSPGIYSRAFLEYRCDEDHLDSFRRESMENGLSSYPHPWLMPHFWQNPSVSMGLSPLLAIHKSHFYQYLQNRSLIDIDPPHVWCFLGDGEMEEPESLSPLELASREKLKKLTFIISCNLQRLDGPVRGNGKIIQQLETRFNAAGWNVIKLVWGESWQKLFDRDEDGKLQDMLNQLKDGEYQYMAANGAQALKQTFEKHGLSKLISDLEDDDLQILATDWGGHDPCLIYSAFKKAKESSIPTVILAKTIKGYDLGEDFAARNFTHKAQVLNSKQSLALAKRLDIPLSDSQCKKFSYYRPDKDSEEGRYLFEARRRLNDSLPSREFERKKLNLDSWINENQEKLISDDSTSTTSVFGKFLRNLLKSSEGKNIVPIICDEARTFGLETLFSSFKLYNPDGQQYQSVDAGKLVEYKESENGQILNEGINEAGCMASFIAAGTSYASIDTPLVPFYIFYSMFGFQRVGDLIWAAADSRAKGFLLGATAGRTTLNGEGLQHQDGHSPLIATTVPNIKSYDPAYGHELIVIMKEGMRRMYKRNESLIYYITLYNERIQQEVRNEVDEQDILNGLYRVKGNSHAKAHLFASGPLMEQALLASEKLENDYDIEASVWSVTSYSELYRQARDADLYNEFNPLEAKKKSHLQIKIENLNGPIIAVSDYTSQYPALISKWINQNYKVLGTDGFGRSDTRKALREYFNINYNSIVWSTLVSLFESGDIGSEILENSHELIGNASWSLRG
jgi:pyruvate dehydrogenase E1 component